MKRRKSQLVFLNPWWVASLVGYVQREQERESVRREVYKEHALEHEPFGRYKTFDRDQKTGKEEGNRKRYLSQVGTNWVTKLRLLPAFFGKLAKPTSETHKR